jgi:formate dehydrogenase major subunit
MLDAALDGSFRAIYIQGEDILQSDPNTHHVAAGLKAMDCVIVHDLFLNETANYAHVFLPGSTFLEKDGTFTNAERRIQPVRKVMEPANGYEDWQVTQLLANAMGLGWSYTHASQIMDEVARLTPSFARVSFARLDEAGSLQWPVNEAFPDGAPVMHVDKFANGKGKFVVTDYVPTDEKTGPRYPLLLTTGRILSHYNVGAQTRRTDNVVWHPEDLLEMHPTDAENRGRLDAAGEPHRRDHLAGHRHRPGRAGRGLHHLPSPRHASQRRHHRVQRLGHQLPRIQGDRGAGDGEQRAERLAGGVRTAVDQITPDRQKLRGRARGGAIGWT